MFGFDDRYALLLWLGFWLLMLFSSCRFLYVRLLDTYNNVQPSNQKYLCTGIWSICYAIGIVGITKEIIPIVDILFPQYIDILPLSIVYLGSQLVGFIAPLVFAAIGANLISHSLTNKPDSSYAMQEKDALIETQAKQLKVAKANAEKYESQIKKFNCVKVEFKSEFDAINTDKEKLKGALTASKTMVNTLEGQAIVLRQSNGRLSSDLSDSEKHCSELQSIIESLTEKQLESTNS
ncbi:hypothetical protein L8S13_03890 [Vibrio lentus]|uniref:hypothetical protein n=1 Tax=Vibrio lentus TaxID=136468 RepID=UPI0024696502|nr:hypothetical protein [Vibrio lentus]MDH5925420.1 hypothetical protein [Vibrio lentus]